MEEQKIQNNNQTENNNKTENYKCVECGIEIECLQLGNHCDDCFTKGFMYDDDKEHSDYDNDDYCKNCFKEKNNCCCHIPDNNDENNDENNEPPFYVCTVCYAEIDYNQKVCNTCTQNIKDEYEDDVTMYGNNNNDENVI